MSRRFNRKSAAIFGTVFLLAAAGAYAYWTAGGSGTGSAATGTSSGITVTQTTTATALVPGGSAALAGKFNNTNAGVVHVNQVNASIGTVTGPNITAQSPCTSADYTLSGFPVTVNADVPTGTAQGNWTGGSIQMVNSGANQDGCKDATVPIVYTSN
jgi:hypothetical protein